MSERELFIFLMGYVVGRLVGVIDTLIKEYIDKHIGGKDK